jgi:hypothetical protein
VPSLFVELVTCKVLPKIVDHFIRGDIQKSAYSIITKNLKTFYEILVHYEKYLVKGAKQTAFVESELLNDNYSRQCPQGAIMRLGERRKSVGVSSRLFYTDFNLLHS